MVVALVSIGTVVLPSEVLLHQWQHGKSDYSIYSEGGREVERGEGGKMGGGRRGGEMLGLKGGAGNVCLYGRSGAQGKGGWKKDQEPWEEEEIGRCGGKWYPLFCSGLQLPW